MTPARPATADEIRQRLTEISFNAAAASELEGIALAKQEAERDHRSLGWAGSTASCAASICT